MFPFYPQGLTFLPVPNATKLRLFLCYRGVSVLPWNALLSQIFEDRKSARRVPGADDRRRGEVEGETDYSPLDLNLTRILVLT